MENVLGAVILTGVVGAIAPLPVIVVVTILMSKSGASKAWAFTGALIGIYAIVGALALTFSGGSDGQSDQGTAIGGTVIAMLGGLLVLLAVKQLVHAPDPDAPPPKFMSKLDSMNAGGALLFGLIIAIINFKQLSIFLAGVAQIVSGGLVGAEAWTALAVLLIVMSIIPLVASAPQPHYRDSYRICRRDRISIERHRQDSWIDSDRL